MRASAATEAGAGLIGSLTGVSALLVLLLFAAQVLYNLYATSVVTAAAFDAALVPAVLLALLVLAAVAVDSSVAFLGEREMANAAAAAANDAAGAAIDGDRFRLEGVVQLDCPRAQEVAAASFLARVPEWLQQGDVEVTACAGEQVTVRAVGSVGYVFSKALPGAPHAARVEATASASAVASNDAQGESSRR